MVSGFVIRHSTMLLFQSFFYWNLRRKYFRHLKLNSEKRFTLKRKDRRCKIFRKKMKKKNKKLLVIKKDETYIPKKDGGNLLLHSVNVFHLIESGKIGSLIKFPLFSITPACTQYSWYWRTLFLSVTLTFYFKYKKPIILLFL